jgi:hypothetical protein
MSTMRRLNVLDEVLDFLTRSPTPQEIVQFRASEAAQSQLQYLLEQNRNGTLTDIERAELEEFGRVEHFFTLIKARALKRINVAGVAAVL